MAIIRVSARARDEAGNVVAGTGFEIRAYVAGTLTTKANYLDKAGSIAGPTFGRPSTSTSQAVAASAASGQAFVQVASTTGFAVGDSVFIDGGGNREEHIIRALVTGPVRVQLADNLANTYATGTLGGPETKGAFVRYVTDADDTDLEIKVAATGKTYPRISFKTRKIEFTAYQVLTDAATIASDLGVSQNAQVTLLASGHAMGAPTNIVAGGKYTFRVLQDGTGGRTMTWNSIFKWPGAVQPVLSTAASAKDLFSFVSPDGTILENVGQVFDVR